MNDTWMNALRREPSTEFTDHLRNRLRDNEATTIAETKSRRPIALAAAAVAVLSVLLAVPAVRASVSEFLSIFRVANFVAVPVEPGRLDRLESSELGIGTLIGEHVQVLADPGAPVNVASLEQAASAAGMDRIAVPQYLPANSSILETTVTRDGAVQITASATRLQQVMDALGITDLSVPAGLDGQVVNVRVPPVVMVRYDHNGGRSRLFQARAPQVSLPSSVDLAALGEIGLRILGLSPADARQFAQTIDWHTTLLVAVPPAVSSFRQVTIGGRPGILLQHQPDGNANTTIVLWSTPDRVFALVTILGQVEEILTMANSVR